jgi:NAD(P)-dependent dehydrogenase (short-subunit alcohol dehydrogenase family)
MRGIQPPMWGGTTFAKQWSWRTCINGRQIIQQLRMNLQDRIIVVTGGANGIGRAMCRRFAQAGAACIVVSDRDAHGAATVASEIGGLAIPCDVRSESEVQQLVERTLAEAGPIDLFVSNAGITVKGGIAVANEDWQRCWDINLMSHVYAARAVLPSMLERKSGYLLQVASAAGLMTEMGSAVYSVTKHAAVAFAEWLAIHYQPQGIRVSCLCPAGVDTGFLNPDDVYDQFLKRTSVTPEAVADSVVAGLEAEKFLILPHPEVGEFFAFKAQNHDKWLDNFAHLNARMQRLAERQRAHADSEKPQ